MAKSFRKVHINDEEWRWRVTNAGSLTVISPKNEKYSWDFKWKEQMTPSRVIDHIKYQLPQRQFVVRNVKK